MIEEKSHYQRIVCDIAKHSVSTHFSKHLLPQNNVKIIVDEVKCGADAIVLTLVYSLVEKKVSIKTINTLQVPATWWEHLKDYLKGRWNIFDKLKIKYDTIDVVMHTYHNCPHINVPEEQLHYQFLMYEDTNNNSNH